MKIFIIFALVLLQINCGQTAQTQTREQSNLMPVNQATMKRSKTEEECVRTKFRYLIVQDILAWESQRHLLVFLDERAFSEENLKELFIKLSKKYSEYDELLIKVETNWERLPMPNDCLPPVGSSERSNGSDENKFHRAIFYRKGASEYFKYNPILNTSDFKTVILKEAKP